jgi:multidrug resistance efflux pump/beta-lactamase regulating signal transducer with metallopeptidase domain
MIDTLGFAPTTPWRLAALGFGLDVALKAAVLILVALALHLVVGRRRVLVRSVLWNACLAGLLALPAIDAAFPRLRIACLPAPLAKGELRLVPPYGGGIQGGPSSSGIPAQNPPRPPLRKGGSDAARGRLLVPPYEGGIQGGSFQQPSPAPSSQEGESRAPWFDAVGASLLAYAAVAALLLLRLARSLAAVGALRRSAVAVEEPVWVEALDRWRTRLRLTRPVRLVRSGRVGVPIVLGWLRPTIVLPEHLDGPAAPRVIDAVLLHELAHVKRADYPWNLALRLAQAIYWPHPCAWLLGRVIGGVREQACDDLCVYWMDDAAAYRASLLDVASGLIQRPWGTIGLAMARVPQSKLGRRLARIERSEGAARCLLRWPARVLIASTVVAAVGVLGSIQLARTAAASGQEPKPEAKQAEVPQRQPQPKPHPKAQTEPKPEPTRDEPKPKASGARQQQGGVAPAGPLRVKTVKVRRGDFVVQAQSPCKLELYEPATVYARVAGTVKRPEVKMSIRADAVRFKDGTVIAPFEAKMKEPNLASVGDRVKSGQVLAELDTPELIAETARAKAQVQQAEAKKDQAEAATKVAQAAVEGSKARLEEAEEAVKQNESSLRHVRKQEDVIKDLVRQHTVPLQRRAEAETKTQAAESAAAAAKARVKVAQAALEQSRAELDAATAGLRAVTFTLNDALDDAQRIKALAQFTRVVSPIDGVVTERHADPGLLVRDGERYLPLFVVARTDVLTAVTNVRQDDALRVDVGDRAIIFISQPIKAKVSRTDYSLDPKDRTLRIEIDIPNRDGRLRPGMFGNATIILETHPRALMLPSTAFALHQDPRTGESGSFYFRVSDGLAVRTPIKINYGNGVPMYIPDTSMNWVEVQEGPKEDEEIVSSVRMGRQWRSVSQNPGQIQDSQPVEVVGPEDGQFNRGGFQ